MRYRTMLLLAFLVLLGIFVALNLSEMARLTTLNLGFTQVQGPMGFVLLSLLALGIVIMMLYAMGIQTAALLEARTHQKEVRVLRELADNAEASRFTELRTLVDQMNTDAVQRSQTLQTWFDQRVTGLQQDIDNHVTDSSNTLAAYMGELEDRFEKIDGNTKSFAGRPKITPVANPRAAAGVEGQAEGGDAKWYNPMSWGKSTAPAAVAVTPNAPTLDEDAQKAGRSEPGTPLV